MGELLAVFSAFFYGASNIYANRGMIEDNLNRYEGLFLSLVVNNIFNFIILPFYLIFIGMSHFNWQGVVFYVLAGIFTSFLARLLLFACIERIKAARASVLKVTAPAFTVIIGITILNENLNIYELLGILIILLGVVLVSLESQNLVKNTQEEDEYGSEDNISLKNSGFLTKRKLKIGIILGILAGLCLGSGNVFRKIGTDFYDSAYMGVLIGAITSLFLMTLFSSYSGKINLSRVFSREGFSPAYLMVGLWYTLATYSIFIALTFSPVSIVNSLSSTQPFFAVILSAILLKKHDIITFRLVLGSLTVITGSSFIFIF